MKRPKNIDTHYMGISRQETLARLRKAAPLYEFRIGDRHVGEERFKHEYGDFEIVAEYRPTTRDRHNRYAIYARANTQALH